MLLVILLAGLILFRQCYLFKGTNSLKSFFWYIVNLFGGPVYMIPVFTRGELIAEFEPAKWMLYIHVPFVFTVKISSVYF